MTDPTVSKKKRAARSTGFPVISLPAAAKIIREAGAYGKQHTSSALATYAGHKTANSGTWLAKVSALKEWGLVSATPPDSFTLTDRAMLIAHPTSAEAGQAALLEAFNHCTLYVGLYDDMAKGIELKSSVIANRAVTDKGVAVTSKEAFARSFVESAIAVGLAEQAGADAIRLIATQYDPSAETEIEDEENLLDERGREEGSPERRKRLHAGGHAPLVNQIWELADGEIAFSVTSTKPLNAKVFTELGKVMEAVESFAKLVGLPSAKAESSSIDVPE
jgi:hypothetical protein